MKRELLQHYCTWLFDILFELERELDYDRLLHQRPPRLRLRQ